MIILIPEMPHKEGTEELRQAKNHLESLFSYANAPMPVWDRRFVITRFNHALERLTGISAGETTGSPRLCWLILNRPAPNGRQR